MEALANLGGGLLVKNTKLGRSLSRTIELTPH